MPTTARARNGALLIPLLGWLLLFAGRADAIETFEGALPDALGLYRIELPDGWQPGGPLIIYNHGLTMKPPAVDGLPATAPSDEVHAWWLDHGYALAASSYASRGWAVFDLARGQRALLATFDEQAGQPGRILLVGGSLGGLVSLRTAETFHADGVDVDGVYSLCAPVAGSRTWDSAVDTRLAFDAICPTPLPSGSEALPWVIDYAQIPDSIDDIDHPDALLGVLPVANVVRKCTGLFQPAMFDTDAQLARRAELKTLLGITDDDFLAVLIGYAVYPLADIIQAPEKLAGHNPFDNRFVDYGDPSVDAAILRVERDPLAAVALAAASDFHGAIGADTRVLGLHTSRDELVVPEHLTLLPQRLPAEQVSTALVREDAPAHCEFSTAEFLAGFEQLAQWSAGGTQPDLAALQADCTVLQSSFPGDDRCAFASADTLASLDSRIRPRGLLPQPITRVDSGTWFDPASSGEGAVVEVLDSERALVSWYSYPPAGEPGAQTWIIGVGRIVDGGVQVDEAMQYVDSGFGADFDPATVDGHRWGSLTFSFSDCHGGDVDAPATGRLRWQGPPGYGSGERTLVQLSSNGVTAESCYPALDPPPPQPAALRYSGSWYRGPDAPGEGLQLQVNADGRLIVLWYTYAPDGTPAWLIGLAEPPADPAHWQVALARPRGTHWGEAFDPAEVVREPWGMLTLDFGDCDHAQLAWHSDEPGFGDGSIALERLTRPVGVPSCAP